MAQEQQLSPLVASLSEQEEPASTPISAGRAAGTLATSIRVAGLALLGLGACATIRAIGTTPPGSSPPLRGAGVLNGGAAIIGLEESSWQCHKYGVGENAQWCGKEGVTDGKEYRWFRELQFAGKPACGWCWCCTRDASSSAEEVRAPVHQSQQLPAPKAQTTAAPETTSKAVSTTSEAAATSSKSLVVAAEKHPSLYCWAIMRNSGYELELMGLQKERGVGLYQCDCHDVFSSEDGTFNGVRAVGIGQDPSRMCNWQNQVFYACNTEVFVKAWEQVVERGNYKKYDWTIKIDPDAGFFPEKLRRHLLQVGGSGPRFVRNANFPKMLGPIEVVSRDAVHLFAQRRRECYDKLNEEYTGEDGYFSDCFSEVLGAAEVSDYGLLDSGNNAGGCYGGAAAVHAFKSRWAMEACYNNGR